jgi:hypothetical protein
MPIHDWTRVDAGLFHHFHQGWTIALCDALNTGRLPPDYFALVELKNRRPIPDLRTFRLSAEDEGLANREALIYADKANRITVQHGHGNVVAVIEILSPGNKGNRTEFRVWVQKSAGLIRQGIHLLVIDLFPPGKYDPQGIHKAIWGEFQEEDFALPPDKRVTLAAYDTGPPVTAYVDPVGVGDVLADMPLFLKPEFYVPAPLEATYQATWNVFPNALKGLLEPSPPPEKS